MRHRRKGVQNDFNEKPIFVFWLICVCFFFNRWTFILVLRTKSQKRAFSKPRTEEKYAPIVKRISDHADVVRLICHTQLEKIPQLRQKKAHIMEIQVKQKRNSESRKTKLFFFFFFGGGRWGYVVPGWGEISCVVTTK